MLWTKKDPMTGSQYLLSKSKHGKKLEYYILPTRSNNDVDKKSWSFYTENE